MGIDVYPVTPKKGLSHISKKLHIEHLQKKYIALIMMIKILKLNSPEA